MSEPKNLVGEAPGAAPSAGAAAPVGAPAAGGTAALAESHGARPIGRPRSDGLKSGSIEAAAADRLKAAERKRRFRLRQAEALAASGLAVPAPAAVDDGGMEVEPDIPGVPWSQDPLRPLCRAAAEGIEALMVASIVGDARKLNLRPEFVSVFAKRARWPDAAKGTFNEVSPACAVEVLNSMGIPADKAHWVGLAGAAGMIGLHFAALKKELAEEIARSKGHGTDAPA